VKEEKINTKMLKILKCSNSMMWYAGKVGETVPFIRDVGNEYLSREPSGLVNIVSYDDAVIVDDG